MSTRINRRIVVAGVLTLLISSLAAELSAQERCSAASLRGSYAFRVDGDERLGILYLPAGPFSAVGRNTYDGHGHMNGVILVSSNGAMIPASYTGTYTLAADCTGTKSAALNIGLTVDFYFVVDSNLRGIEMIRDAGWPGQRASRRSTTSAAVPENYLLPRRTKTGTMTGESKMTPEE